VQMMQINDSDAYRRCEEIDLVEELVDVRGRRVLELGCGTGRITRQLMTRLAPMRITATEVDLVQHRRNLEAPLMPGVSFRYGGAESIKDPDAAYDLVFMFKSLHHVPVALMKDALHEIHRILVPGGLLYVSEPVYRGAFNEIMRLIEDERTVRMAAFDALRTAIGDGLFELVDEVFFESEGFYLDWPSFAARFVDVTHSERNLDEARLVEIRAAFERHMTPHGARLWKPHRVDLLRRVERS
jgi:SAM-dependent methyltransferase